MKVKYQKELRMSKFTGIDGGFLTDRKRKGTCHRIPYMWEGRPTAFSQVTGDPSHHFFEWGERIIPGKGVIWESKKH